MPRRTVSRYFAGAVAFALVLGGLEITVAQASVAPTSLVTVDGFLTTVSSSNPDLLVVNYTVTVQGEDLTAAQLSTTTFPSAPVDPTTVQVDGATAPTTTITQTATKMTVRLGTGADATDGGSLGVGSYLVSYQQQRPTGVPATTSTSGKITFIRGGVSGSVTSNSIALEHPDLTLSTPRGSGEDKVAPLGTGRMAVFGAYLRNTGATADDATLTLTLPPGLRLDSLDGVIRLEESGNDFGETSVKCSNVLTATVTCDLGAVEHGKTSVVLIPVVATRSAKVGTHGTFHVSVAPTGEPDQNTSNDTVSGRVRFTGVARLKATLTSKLTKVPVGSRVTVKVRIKNLGPQPAGMAYGLLITGSRHFVISKFLTKRHPKSGPKYERVPAPARYGSVLQWNTGTIGAHSTAYARVILKAKSVGKSVLEFVGQSAAGDPSCDSEFGNCRADTKLKLTAIRKPAATKAGKVEHT